MSLGRLDSPFDSRPSRRVPFEAKEATTGPKTKKKLKKISFSIGGLASSSSHFNNIDQLDHIQVLLPPTPLDVAMALPRDHSRRIAGYSDAVLYGYDNENDDLYCYHGAFALGEETDEEFARHHWMIDSGCTDHLLQTHINFPRFLPIFPDFLERLSHLAPIY
jgi:hypothetical protein